MPNSNGHRATLKPIGTPGAIPLGRPKGAKCKVPVGFKATIKAMFGQVAHDDPDLIRQAIERGLRSSPPRSFAYLQLAASYLDGRPIETLRMAATNGAPPAIDFSKLTNEEMKLLIALLRRATERHDRTRQGTQESE